MQDLPIFNEHNLCECGLTIRHCHPTNNLKDVELVEETKEEKYRENDISSWMEYGKKNGYFDFLELEKEALPKLYSGSRIYNILLQVQDGSISCGRAIELIREII